MSDRSAANAAGDTAGQATDTARKLYDASGEVIQHGTQQMHQQGTQQMQTATDQVIGLVREQPLAAVLSALIIGYVLGKIT